jgi:hypothetical protein
MDRQNRATISGFVLKVCNHTFIDHVGVKPCRVNGGESDEPAIRSGKSVYSIFSFGL